MTFGMIDILISYDKINKRITIALPHCCPSQISISCSSSALSLPPQDLATALSARSHMKEKNASNPLAAPSIASLLCFSSVSPLLSISSCTSSPSMHLWGCCCQQLNCPTALSIIQVPLFRGSTRLTAPTSILPTYQSFTFHICWTCSS